MFKKIFEKVTTVSGTLRGDLGMDARRMTTRCGFALDIAEHEKFRELSDRASAINTALADAQRCPDSSLSAMKAAILKIHEELTHLEIVTNRREQISGLFRIKVALGTQQQQSGQGPTKIEIAAGRLLGTLIQNANNFSSDDAVNLSAALVRCGSSLDAFKRESFALQCFSIDCAILLTSCPESRDAKWRHALRSSYFGYLDTFVKNGTEGSQFARSLEELEKRFGSYGVHLTDPTKDKKGKTDTQIIADVFYKYLFDFWFDEFNTRISSADSHVLANAANVEFKQFFWLMNVAEKEIAAIMQFSAPNIQTDTTAKNNDRVARILFHKIRDSTGSILDNSNKVVVEFFDGSGVSSDDLYLELFVLYAFSLDLTMVLLRSDENERAVTSIREIYVSLIRELLEKTPKPTHNIQIFEKRWVEYFPLFKELASGNTPKLNLWKELSVPQYFATLALRQSLSEYMEDKDVKDWMITHEILAMAADVFLQYHMWAVKTLMDEKVGGITTDGFLRRIV